LGRKCGCGKTRHLKPDAKRKKNRGGRPTDYKPEYADLAYKFSLLGSSDKQMASFFGVCEKTFNTWKQNHPKFLQSMQDGKEKADGEVADRLYQRAKGYFHPEVELHVIDGKVHQTNLIKHYPPDTAAASLWLRNRQPEKWRDKPEFSLSVENNISVDASKPVEEMGEAELYAECKRRGLFPKIIKK
jgi:hypothetical protein